jgi:hypothetical protein
MDQSPTSEAPRAHERRIGRRVTARDGAQLSFAERRPYRRVRRVTVDVDVVDMSITGLAVKVLDGRQLTVGTVVHLTFRGASGAAVVRHAGERTEAGLHVYGLEVPDTSRALVEALRDATGAQLEDVRWRWDRSE